MEAPRLSFLVFPQGRYWVAQCIEYDITTQTKSLRGIEKAVECAIVGHILVSIEIGKDPFNSLPSAPKEYKDAFELGIPLPELEGRFTPLRIPERAVPSYPDQKRYFRVGELTAV